MIGVIDYRAGNAPSVGYALERLGIPHRLVAAADALEGVERIILPGVGAARATIDSLEESGLVAPLAARVLDDRTPFLGICIGLQVLFEHSGEGDVDCLGWVPGTVQRFPDTLRVPQIGWNAVRTTRAHPVTDGLGDDAYCYFVNSFYAVPTAAADTLGVTEYGDAFCSIVGRDNIVATQFHAEKSGPVGLALLERFSRWDGTC
ncbi:MAG: imidazole glycerol phosphate synthase subunit HisH [Acidimicrobiia bacterium]